MKQTTYGLDEIDGGDEIYEITPELKSENWGATRNTWRFFEYVINEVRSDHNHLAVEVTGEDPEVCKRLARATFDAISIIDAQIAHEARERHNAKARS